VKTGAKMTTKLSDSAAVDAFMKTLKHPLSDLAQALRNAMLAVDPTIGEEIKWNAPAFFYTGAMKPFDPKEYRRHLVVFNFYRKDCVRLVFWHGDRARDKSGLLEGDYADGRRLAHFCSAEELAARKAALTKALRAQLRHIEKQAVTLPSPEGPGDPRPSVHRGARRIARDADYARRRR
jgi:hypothetical protein